MPVKLKTSATITLTAGGTAQKLAAAPAAAMRAYITCPSANAGNIWVGDSTVKASTKTGIEVVKGTTLIITNDSNDLFDIGTLYFDGTTNDLAGLAYIGPANG